MFFYKSIPVFSSGTKVVKSVAIVREIETKTNGQDVTL